MLGERIREIRKKKKMTLEALAGDELTKGMLSLIENNKANPSMESLTYIAGRLGVEVSELLEEVSSLKLREILDEAEKLYNKGIEIGEETDKFKQLIDLIGPYLEHLSQGYESARLLEIYSRSLQQEGLDGWQELSKKAAKMYDEMNLTAKRASIGIFWAMIKFVEHDYAESLKIFLQERRQIEAKHHFIDPMTRVDLDYNEAILHFAVGDSEAAADVMQRAIQFSKEHRIFYRIDDLYRLAAAHGLMKKNKQQQLHYTEKVKQYGDFAEDLQSLTFYDLFHALSLNAEEQKYDQALEICNKYLANPATDRDYQFWFLLEKGKSLYGLKQWQEALACLEKVEIPAYAHHPYDLSLFYIKDSYRALCYSELKQQKEAIQAAMIAVENFKSMPPTPYKDFAIETYESIISKDIDKP
ncbi:helix-turn-helix transcriptional regulator [Neobacillus sp. YIM B02564]|jgi:transcriptional regulator with XRE-family HTH domain|uniref:Helix-turn-helix transcriptional regulator n=1 Tax=Neobacillus paridis TaxID=2803862 RepID=A0ABS1TSL9_9BACI|nr:helix-turn-helix transcriptional regulator [Neobacillus paridis]MBL4953563.1 helix-turn-helix transcriptional regulator [Neobacillus paridis]